MPTNLCEKLISENIQASCTNPIFGGLEQSAYIFNRSDVTAITYAVDETTQEENRFLLRSLTLREGARGYKILNLGNEPFNGTTNDMTTGSISNRFTHTFVFQVPDNGATAAETSTNLANGKFIVIYQNQYSGSDGTATFEVVGAAKGAVSSSQSQPKYGETEGSNTVTLIEENSPYQSQFFVYQGTDDLTTAEYLDSLCE